MPVIHATDVASFKDHCWALIDRPLQGFTKLSDDNFVRRVSLRYDMRVEKRGKTWFADIAQCGNYDIERFQLASATGATREKAALNALEMAIKSF